MVEPVSLFFLYLLSLGIMVNFLHPFFFWLLVEVNLMIFIFYCSSSLTDSTDKMKNESLLYYFLLQCMASFFLVFSCFMSESALGFSSTWSYLILISILLKLGFFPLHFWMYNFCSLSSYYVFFLVLVPQKIPLLLFFFSINWEKMILLLVASSLAGSFFLWKSGTLCNVLVSSGIYLGVWLLVMYSQSFFFFFSFYFLYGIFTFVGCQCKDKTYSETCYSKYLSILIFSIFVIGLPPFSMFLLEFFSFGSAAKSFDSMILFSLFVVGFSAMMGYFKFFFKFFFISMNDVSIMRSSLSTLFFSFFFFFFLFF